MKPLLAIVGRPNVGKSTLFNRIIGQRRAIVEDLPGVTRDRHYGEADWAGRGFLLVDTGGFEPDAEDELRSGMRRQAQLAVEEAQATVLVLDATTDLTAADLEIAAYLRRSGRPVVVAANKVDSVRRSQESVSLAEAHGLGFPVVPVSAEHGKGVGDLLDAVLEMMPSPPDEPEAAGEDVIRLAVLGRPNVGKSTLVNRFLGEERFLATSVAGTTRDSLDARVRYRNQTYVITDTAGIRRKRSISASVEHYSVVRALKTMERADVVVMVMDANEPGVAQEARLAAMAVERGRGLVLAVNKWDMVKDQPRAADRLRATVEESFPELGHVPVVLLSALEGKRVYTLLETVSETHAWLEKRIPTPELNRWLEGVTAYRPPPAPGGKPLRLFYAAQVGTRPPVVAITVSRPDLVPESYRRFLMNQFREAFGFPGVPVRLVLKARRGRGDRSAS